MNRLALACDNLSIVYANGVHAVRNVSFTLREGECLALVGESGCGKTTMAHAALGLLPSSARVSGSIRIGENQIVGAPESMLQKLRGMVVGFVTQDPFEACNPLDRGETHVAEAWRAHGSRPPAGVIGDALSRLGIANAAAMMRGYPHQWSGGMLQRAIIAAAAAHRPRLIIADEPTSALDADLADATLTALRRTGATILLISHDIGVVARHADRVAVMYVGRIVEVGGAPAVLDRPRHPYTRGLLRAMPRSGAGLPEPLQGTPPDPADAVAGCAFAPRCCHAESRCRSETPVLTDGVACPVVASLGRGDGEFGSIVAAQPPTIAVNQRRAASGAFVAEARGVSKTYNKGAKSVSAVVRASLQVRAGEIVGICGPSGGGKSTFLRMLATIESPDDGGVYFGSVLVASAGAPRITRGLARSGYVMAVFQDPMSSLDRRWPLWRTITEPLLARHHVPKAARRAQAKEALQEVELSHVDPDARPDELSVGQCQRVSIARALVGRPQLLVADEPTSALDASLSASILHLLAGAAARGTAIVMVSHDKAVLHALCHRVVTMRGGVLEDGG